LLLDFEVSCGSSVVDSVGEANEHYWIVLNRRINKGGWCSREDVGCHKCVDIHSIPAKRSEWKFEKQQFR